jgi:hypothetical protein
VEKENFGDEMALPSRVKFRTKTSLLPFMPKEKRLFFEYMIRADPDSTIFVVLSKPWSDEGYILVYLFVSESNFQRASESAAYVNDYDTATHTFVENIEYYAPFFNWAKIEF